jgi:GNAT superfamily N-acetyltransferase
VKVSVEKVALGAILNLREYFLKECNTLIRYHACHERGWCDSYLIRADGMPAGYGSVKGFDDLSDRDTLFEFHSQPAWRLMNREFFKLLINETRPHFIECQSNEPVLFGMATEFGTALHSDVILFEAGTRTHIELPGVTFRKRKQEDTIFSHSIEPVGDYVLERGGEIVATGGVMTHYNPPFADLYMEVRPACRRQGLGSLLLQELKKVCTVTGRVPAARCKLNNIASRRSLRKAGFRECGYMVRGVLPKQPATPG